MTRNEAAMQLGEHANLVGMRYLPTNGQVYREIESIGIWCFGGEKDWFPVIQFLIPGEDIYTNIKISEALPQIYI